MVVATRGVADLMDKEAAFSDFVASSFQRYLRCDWGDLDEEDKESNDQAVLYGERILAAYIFASNPDWKIWIITEWDRSVTTVLFPDEY